MNEEAVIRALLEKARPRLPAEVTDLRIEVGRDWSGDDAIWVWIEMPDDAPDEVWGWDSRQAMRDTIRTAIEDSGLEHLLYVRFTDPPDSELYKVA